MKTAIDFTDGVRPGHIKENGGGDSEEEEEDSDVPARATQSGKRKVAGTKSRPVRHLHDEVFDHRIFLFRE